MTGQSKEDPSPGGTGKLLSGESSSQARAGEALGEVLQQVGCDQAVTLRTLLTESHDGIALLDLEGRALWLNDRCARFVGLETSEALGLSAESFVPASERDHHDQVWQALRRGEPHPGFERKVQRPDGTEGKLEVSVSPLFSGDGKPAVVLAIVRDITQKWQAERITRVMVEGVAPTIGDDFFEALADSLTHMLAVCSAGVCRIDPLDPDQLQTLAFSLDGELVPQIRYGVQGTPCEELLTGRTVHVASGVQDQFPEDELLSEYGIDGFLGLPLMTSGECVGTLFLMDRKPLALDPDDWLLRVFAARCAAELEHRSSRRALRREEARRHRILEYVPAVLYECSLDPRRPPYFMGSGIEEMTGYTADEWAKPLEDWLELVVPEDRDHVERVLLHRLEDPGPYSLEYRIRRKDGELMWLRDEASPLSDGGGNLVVVGALFNITNQRLLEEQAANSRRLESLGQLAAGVAHDFNNLLMTAIGQLSLAKLESEENRDLHSSLMEIEDALVRATGLTRQLLSLSKGGAPVRRPVSIEQTIRETATFAVSGSRISPEFHIDDPLWKVSVDQSQLSQVIESLVFNAVQAMPDGGSLTIEARNVEVRAESSLPLPPGRYVRCRVQDEGVGIPPESLPKIFDPYFSTKHRGSGLGLASSHAIVRRHDGLLVAESVPGGGSTFTFHLPVATEEGEKSRSKESPSPAERVKALVLDDDPPVLRVVERMLERLDLDTTAVETGEKAVAEFQAAQEAGEPFHLAFLDLTIVGEGMGGLEVARELRELDSEVTLVVTSGYSDNEVMAHYEEYGFDECLAKPYTFPELTVLVRSLLLLDQ